MAGLTVPVTTCLRGSCPAALGSANGSAAAWTAALVAVGVVLLRLALLTRATTPDIFRKIAWTNGHRLIGLAA